MEISLQDYIQESVRSGKRPNLNYDTLINAIENNGYSGVSSDIRQIGKITIPMDMIRQFNRMKVFAEFVDEDTADMVVYLTTGVSPTVVTLRFSYEGYIETASISEVTLSGRFNRATEWIITDDITETIGYLRKHLKGL